MLYLWGLDESGWANAYYSAAAQAGAESWKAFFFGSLDSANSITVDKTPLALWPQALSVRFFGLSSWSVLVPQALIGVATVYLLLRIVRRATGSHTIGLIAGATLAFTPVAALMFRFNNPDALLVLLLTAAAGATLRAIEETEKEPGHPTRWVVAVGALVGLAYLAKMLQAFLVLPAFALTYVLFAAVPLRRRIGHLLLAGVAMVVAGGWWVAAVALWPTDDRPYIGGSQTNSVLDLTIGYNGFGRLNGEEVGSIGSGHWGTTALWRLLTPSNGGQAGWLLPTALILIVVGLVVAGRHPASTRRVRAILTLFSTWLVVTALVFSLMRGIYHAYYAVALAPAIAVVVAVGGATLWQARHERALGTLLGSLVIGTGAWSFALLARTSDYLPWLRWVIAVAALGAGARLIVNVWSPPAGARHVRRAAPAALILTVLVGLAGPAAYSVATASLPHQGAVITAGPNGRGTAIPTAYERIAEHAATIIGPISPRQALAAQPLDHVASELGVEVYRPTYGPAGSLLHISTPTPRVIALLRQDGTDHTWAAATVGANAAAGFQLATHQPVMAIGGFNGTDPNPTLEQFQRLVTGGAIRWFIGGGVLGSQQGGSDAAQRITAWVAANFEPRIIDGISLYDLADD